MDIFGVTFSPERLQFIVMMVLLLAVLLYVRMLKKIRQKPKDQSITKPDDGSMSDTELDRYARHIVLRELGGAGQQRLRKAKVLVVGAGGLGSPVLQYLAAAGVGTIGVIDDDHVSLSNLQRQVLFDEEQLDMPKVFAAQIKLTALNPHIEIRPYHRRLDLKDAKALVADYDLVLDGTDNFITRSLVNQSCVAQSVPLISGAITQWEGQITLFDPANGTPCYACLFPEEPADGLAPSCAEAGVVGALPGIVGSIMAAEAIKHITGAGQTLSGEMLIFDALYGESRKITLQKTDDCPVCS
ncbi:HesA/MoeB/ThiF family protein [Amylibacter sp. SFDW26]|uniref:HesA/MoeB/ThiF family protein n=1 Tax=Amylibacter sp. SFDW26 TaxID=2652722 RepID=UPI0012626CC3|nr:HesA/MoeB/ThiF family protein [Amylibacter sp. SFDW26]KAB7613328.1 HesA/MoeB/ThiF family protein [Amylibacter sp. SFDW26]